MADRIFPTKLQNDSLDSELVYTGINWDTFGQRLAEVKEAEKDGKMPKELIEHFESMKGEKDAETEDDKVEAEADTDEEAGVDAEFRGAKRAVPEAFKKQWEKNRKKNDGGEDKSEMDDNGKKIVRGKEASAAPRKVHFASSEQISADAIETALAEGDEALANAILAARQERRVRLASKIEEAAKEQMERQAKLAKRHAYRMAIVNSVEETEKRIAEAMAEDKTVKTAKSESGFTKVSSLEGADRDAFVKVAEAQGFPREYVLAMLGESVEEASLSADAQKIQTVMASELDKTVKTAAVEGLVKVATLTNADYDRLIRYWVDELGYGDEAWVRDLFTKKYDN